MPPLYSAKNGYDRQGNQRFKPDKKKYLHNIDTLWLNVDSHMYNDVMDNGLRDMLIEGRTVASNGEEPHIVQVKLEGYPEPIIFEIFGGQPPLYQYSIRNDSMAFYFAKNKRENNCPMKIQINQFVLWEKGVQAAYDESLAVLKTLGFLPFGTKLNRIDFAVHSDQFCWNLYDMQTFDYPRNFSADNEPNFFRLNPCSGKFETFMVGDRSRLAIRIYDKSKEIEAKKKYYFYELYRKHNMDCENVWNIEIEVRRPYLKDLADTDKDLEKIFNDFDYCLQNDGISKLWSHLLGKYTHDSAHWKMLKQLTKDEFKFNERHGLTVIKDIDSNFQREVAQISGRLMTAVMNEEDTSFGFALSKLIEAHADLEAKRRKENKLTWDKKVKQKKQKIHSFEILNTIKKSPSKTDIKPTI